MLLKLSSYCAYQERAQSEVLQKLLDLGATDDQSQYIIQELISMNFINEERFARVFTMSKFRAKKWGKYKITTHLRSKNISQDIINNSLSEIPESEYIECIVQLVQKKEKSLHREESFTKKRKILNYMLSKGFETDLVLEACSKINS